jgi:hypothetical protein
MNRVCRDMLRALLVIAVIGFSGLAAGGARSAELLMFERAGCPWCQRWDREVSATYPRTPEGMLAPLRRINLDHGQPSDVNLSLPVRFTPTFVLIDEGREVGRIIGYMDESTFWGLLSKLVHDHQKRRESEGVSPRSSGRPG